MKHNCLTKYPKLAILIASLTVINNCGKETDFQNDAADHESLTSDAASDNYTGVFRIPQPLPVPTLQVTESDCNNGVDDDGDGLVDCADPDCHVHPECAEYGAPITDVENSRSTTVYPNGLLVVEDIAIRKDRPAYLNIWDDYPLFDEQPVSPMFDTFPSDCLVILQDVNPYYYIPAGEALVAGPHGPIGPQLIPSSAVAHYGPRAGAVDQCAYFGTSAMFWNADDDDEDLEEDVDDGEFCPHCNDKPCHGDCDRDRDHDRDHEEDNELYN